MVNKEDGNKEEDTEGTDLVSGLGLDVRHLDEKYQQHDINLVTTHLV